LANNFLDNLPDIYGPNTTPKNKYKSGDFLDSLPDTYSFQGIKAPEKPKTVSPKQTVSNTAQQKSTFEPSNAEMLSALVSRSPFGKNLTKKIQSGQQLTSGELNAARYFNLIKSADNSGNRILNDIKAGFGDVLATAGGVAQYLGAENIGKEMQRRGEATSAIWGQTSPNFGDDIIRALPFTLSLAPVMMGAGLAGAGVAGAAGLGEFGSAVIGSIAGGAASRPLESLMEAGGTYNDARARGMSVEDAEKAADSVFRNNMKLGIMDIAELGTAFLPAPSNVKNAALRTVFTGGGKTGSIARFLARMGLTGAQEGLEEGIQENIQRSAMGEPVSWTDPQVKRAMEIGAVFGVGMGTAGAAYRAIKDSALAKLSPEAQQTYNTVVEHYKSTGMTQDQAEVKALNGLANTDEGTKIIQQAVPEAIDTFNQGVISSANELDSLGQINQPVQQRSVPQASPGIETIVPASIQQGTQSQLKSPTNIDALTNEKYNEPKAEIPISQNTDQGGDIVVTGIQGRDAITDEEALSKLEQRITQGAAGSIPQGTRVYESIADEKKTKDVQAAEQIAGLFGHKFVHFSVNKSLKTTNKDLYDKANNFNGAVVNGTIFINSDRTNPAHAVTGHEIVHEIAKDNDVYSPFIKELKSLVSQEGHDRVKALVQVYEENGISITEDHAWEEFAGDFMGEQMTKKSFWDRLAQKSPGAVKKAIEVIKKAIAGLRKKVSKGNSVEEFIADLEKAHELAVNAVARYLENNAIANADAAGMLTETDKALLNYLRVHEKKTLTEAISYFKLEIEKKINFYIDLLKKEINEGNVEKYGQVIGSDGYPTGEWYKGGSTHAKWYRDFWAEHNRRPNDQDLKVIAENWLRNGITEGEAAHGMEVPPDDEILGLEGFLSELQEIEQRLANSQTSGNVRGRKTDNGEGEGIRFSIKNNDSKTKEGNRVKEQLGFDFSAEAKNIQEQLEINFPEVKGKEGTEDAARAIVEVQGIEQGRISVSGTRGEMVPPGRRTNEKGYRRFEESGIKTLGVAISQEIVNKGKVDFKGREINSPEELAALAQVFRDPRFETARYFYVKNGKIVAHEGVSSRATNVASISVFNTRQDIINDIKDRIKRTGATDLYMLHNHPSGNPSPSKEDINVTMMLATNLRQFKGHVVINHSKYTVIDRLGNVVEKDLNLKENDKLLVPSIPNNKLGKLINSPSALADIAVDFVYSPDRFVVVYVGGQTSGVKAIQDLPSGMLENTGNLINYLRGRTREFGGVDIFFVSSEQLVTEKNKKTIKSLINGGILRDTVYINEPRGNQSISSVMGEMLNNRELGVMDNDKWMGMPIKGKRVWEEGNKYQLKADPFYSKLQRTIEAKMPEKTTAAQVLAIVDNPQNVKPEEVKWSGIRLWLQGKDKVAKDEVLGFLHGNQLRIEEVERGGTYKYTPEQSKRLDELTAKQTEITERVVELYKSEFNEEMPFSVIASDNRRAMFGQFKGRGFSDKGREILGKLRDEFDDSENEIDEIVSKGREKSETKFFQYVLPGGENYRELLFTLPDKTPVEQKQTFRSSHWDEPNVLAHTRFNERTTPDGEKVLFVEEIQSDWHQAGRDKGYYDDRELPVGWHLRETDTHWVVDSDKYGEEKIKVSKDIENAKEFAIKRAQEMAGTVPDAPFRKTWHEFVLKRLIRLAAENDFDYMAWATGEQQAERYNLRNKLTSFHGKLSCLHQGFRSRDGSIMHKKQKKHKENK
jgi:hypothetical protein